MAAPTLEAAGSTAAVTTGSLTVTLPAHQADDILVVTTIDWVPNTAGAAAIPGTPAGWSVMVAGLNVSPGGQVDGHIRIYWKRATSSSEADPVFTRGSGWDTGTDTCFAGRAYVIRGANTFDVTPWDDAQNAGFYTTANQAIPALVVDGPDRLAMVFVGVTDNTAINAAPTGWTSVGGAPAVSNTGTGANFAMYRKTPADGVDTSADASNVDAPGAGAYGFFGISFQPSHLDATGDASSVAVHTGEGTVAAVGDSDSLASPAGDGAVAALGDESAAASHEGSGALAGAGDAASVAVHESEGTVAGDGEASSATIHEGQAAVAAIGDVLSAAELAGLARVVSSGEVASVALPDGLAAITAKGDIVTVAVIDGLVVGKPGSAALVVMVGEAVVSAQLVGDAQAELHPGIARLEVAQSGSAIITKRSGSGSLKP